MNHRILFLFYFISLSFFVKAQQTYYWVGGTGNWSNLDEWATTSGGTERFGVLPGPADNVIFDENSFSGDGNQIAIDVETEMNDLTITNIGFEAIELYEDGGKFSVSGNVSLHPNVKIPRIYFSSGNTSTFHGNGYDSGTSGLNLTVDGTSTLVLEDSVFFGTTLIQSGSNLDLNGQTAQFVRLDVYGTLTSTDAAKIYLQSRFLVSPSAVIDVATSTFYGDEDGVVFNGRGGTYYQLVMPNVTISGDNTIEKIISIGGKVTLNNENAIDSLIVNGGDLELLDNTTNTIGYLEVKGASRSEFAEILGGNNQSTLDLTDEPVLSYCSFENINITASETIIANNSLDLGNNSGFTINEITPLTYYWIGGSGDLSDPTHWATSSGGSELNEYPFANIDHIVFDANSTNGKAFITSSDEISIHHFEMIGVTDSIVFEVADINLYGIISLAETTVSESMTIRFRGTEVATQNLGSNADNQFNLYFHDGEHTLLGDTLRTNTLFIDGGTANLSDKYIETVQLYVVSGTGNFENSTLMVDWRMDINNEPNATDFTNAKVVLSDNKNLYARWPYLDIDGDTISSVRMGNETQLLSTGSFDTLKIAAGNSVEILESVKVAKAVIEGTQGEFIQLEGFNGAKFISREGLDINISYTELTNLPAEGATMTADFSIDREGNDGWTFTNEIVIPNIPTGLSTSDITNNSYRAMWDEVPGATSYIVAFSTAGIETAWTYEITDNFYDYEGTRFRWWIAAKNEVGTSNYSDPQSVTFAPEPPEISENYIQATTTSLNYTLSQWFGVTAYIDLSLDENFSTFVGDYENFEVSFEDNTVDDDFIFESLEEETEYFCRIRLGNESGVSNYSETYSFTTASKLTQSITFLEISDKTILDEPFELEVSATSGLSVEVISSDPEVASVVGKVVTIHSLGEVTFTASQAGNDGFKPAATAQQLLTVIKATPTIQFTDMSKTYGDSGFEVPASTESELTFSFSSTDESVAILEGDVLHITGAGTTDITVSLPGNEVYFPASKTQTLTVGKGTLTVTAANQTKVYGDQNPALTFEYTGFAYEEEPTVIDTPPTASTLAVEDSPVGEYDIVLSSGEDNHYEFSYVSGMLTIEKASQTINFSAIEDKTLQDSPISLEANTTAGLPVTFTLLEGDGTISGATLTVNDAGTFTVTASQPGNNNYTEAPSVSQSFVVINSEVLGTVEKSPVVIYPNPATDKLKIEGIEFDRMYLYDLRGQLMVQSGNSRMISVKSLTQGVYFLKLFKGNQVIHSQKLLVN